MKEAIIQYNDTPSDGHLVISWKPLVRCKDCKKQGDLDCHITSLTGQKSSDDWFCADGVAKDINVPNKEGR